ncbi:MAG: AbrB family transcriptional regulator [Rhizobiales bacterium]|nr:AbrB family transcriptional regulator [Hyphomicrobiales bacterium]
MSAPARLRHIGRVAVTLALSAAGGVVASWIGLPAAWVSGGLLVVAVASLAGVNTEFPRPLLPPVFLVLGIYAGSGVSRETLHQIETWPASFALLGVSLIGVIAGSTWWLHARCGWDRSTALLASFPGALSLVLAVAEDLKADLKKVAIAQSLRLLILAEAIPLVALVAGRPAVSSAAALAPAGPLDLVILLAAGIVASLVMERLRFPGGWMLGGLTSAAILFLGGWVEGGLPGFVVIPCTIAIAAIAGSRFRPGDLAILPHIARPALVAFAIAIAISGLAAGAVSFLFGINFVQTLIAFAPGALETLIILATQMNIDPAYVAAHHVVRLLALVAAVPLLSRWLRRRP